MGPMQGTMIEFAAGGRVTSGYLSQPPSGRGPGLVVLQEWWGLVDHIKVVTDRYAQAGFVALALDLFHGETTTQPDDAGRLMMALNIEEAATELKAAVAYLRSQATVDPKKVGTLGFCMGGQLALYAAQVGEVDAVVDFYGIHPNVQIEPAKISAAVQCHFGNNDEFVALTDAQALVERLSSAGVATEAHFYETGHAFFNDTRPGYAESSAQVAFDRSVAFLKRELA